jgi:transcription antitermination factor NusB
MGKRHQARELAIKVLFHLEYNPGDPAEGFELICNHFGSSAAIKPFGRELVLGVSHNQSQIDQLISQSSKNWRLERMSCADRNILRLAVFEVLFLKEIPPKVSIDEAVELGKRYGTKESGAFINGVLDHIYNELPKPAAVPEAPKPKAIKKV